MSAPTARPVLSNAWIFDGPGGARIQKAELASQQLVDDPFNYGEGQAGLQTPPYHLEQLSSMLETNTLHARCVRQKGLDIAGRGFTLRPRSAVDTEDGAKASAKQEDTWHAFVETVEDDERGDETLKERIERAHMDFESVGWAILEVSRNGQGVPDGLWHVPGHTIRAHRDGRRFAQVKGSKTVWFKRFGLEGEVAHDTGTWVNKSFPTAPGRGNELIVIDNYTPRSQFYGLPDHIPAAGAIAGWRAQAEFNLKFFDNHAVPSYAVIIEGADLTPELELLIMEHFVKLKGDPHRTLVIPVPGNAGDDATAPKVRFEKLTVDVKDATHRLYKQDNALEICIAHGMPPYRVGWPIVGSLGGDTAVEMTRIYLDSIVQTRQETWEQRLNRTLLGRRGLEITDWQLKANELDVRDVIRDLALAKGLWELNVTTPNDSARVFGYAERDVAEFPQAGMTRVELEQLQGERRVQGIPADLITKQWRHEVTQLADLRKRVEAIAAPVLAVTA